MKYNEMISDEQLMQEMIEKVDKKKCIKLLAMCYQLPNNKIEGFDSLLKEWAKNKLWIYKLLENKLTLEKEVEHEEISGEEVSDFLNEVRKISYFIEKSILKISRENFKKSKISMRYVPHVFQIPTVFEVLNKTGEIKISKLLNLVFKCEELNIAYSKLMQNSTKKAKLYISIDPFDYITMSMNKSGWSSCHSLHNSEELEETGTRFGCYSAGVFSYLCDETTLISYRTSGKEYDYNFNKRTIKAESKNWRQLIYLHQSQDYFICSRQYPCLSENNSKIVRSMLEELLEKRENINTKNPETNWSLKRGELMEFIENYGSYDDNGIEKEIIDKQTEQQYENDDITTTLQYNDILNEYEGILVRKKIILDTEYLDKITIGSRPICPICGKTHLFGHGMPFCAKCKDEHDLYNV